MNATHRYDPDSKRIVPIEADESQDAAIDAFIESKGKDFLRDLLVAYEQSEGPEVPAEENPDESRVRQAGAAELGRGESEEEEPPEESEQEPAEEEQEPVGKRGGKVIAFRNGRRVAIAG
ncbi:MAG TPA: hypothetical protein VGR55_00450 [Candidatus Acidoferrum sp.]|nr:hypothetical protein [Candidatus Acidoferrum sp.]